MNNSSSTAEQYRDAYRGVHLRLAELLATTDGSEPVPSCPGWTIRDVLAHLVGLCEDWIQDRRDGYASPSWTNEQITRYHGHSVTDLLRRWTEIFPDFARLDDDPTVGSPARWAFGDAIIHEADLRGALEIGRAPHDAVVLSLEGTIVRWRTLFDNANPRTTLILRPPDAPEWILGPTTTNQPIVGSPTTYELFRALAGRRTETQVRAWAWSADPDSILRLGLPYPFQWARSPITD